VAHNYQTKASPVNRFRRSRNERGDLSLLRKAPTGRDVDATIEADLGTFTRVRLAIAGSQTRLNVTGFIVRFDSSNDDGTTSAHTAG
jgi:hypothetical protein